MMAADSKVNSQKHQAEPKVVTANGNVRRQSQCKSRNYQDIHFRQRNRSVLAFEIS